MKISISGALAAAWHDARRDTEVLLPITALFLFLPTLAILLLIAAPPAAPAAGAGDEQMSLFIRAYGEWLVGNAPAFGAGAACALMGSATIAAFYLDRQAHDLRDALVRAVGLLPRFLLAGLIIAIPTFIGATLFLVPGLYVMARTMLAGPILVAERPMTALGAVMRSLKCTRGDGLLLTGLSAMLLLAGQILPWPFLEMAQSLGDAHAANPVVVALLSMVAAALSAAVALATILTRIAVYRHRADAAPR